MEDERIQAADIGVVKHRTPSPLKDDGRPPIREGFADMLPTVS
jgi:hypothetical protein